MRKQISDGIVYELIDRVYAAGCDPKQWPRFVEEVRTVLPGTLVSTHLHLENTTLIANSAAAGIEDDILDAYLTHYQFHNPYIPLFENFEVGKVQRLSSLMDVRDIKKHLFYHEWLKPAGDLTHGAGITLRRDDKRLLRVTIDIPDRIGHMEQAAARLLLKLGPHITRAFEVNEKLQASSLAQSALEGMLAALEGAAFVVAPNGKVLCANEKAQALSRSGALCRIRLDGRLHFRQPQQHDAYLAALAAVSDPSRGEAPATFNLNTADREIASVLPLRPLTNYALSSNRGATALVLVRGSAELGPPPRRLLQLLYGLTAAEAEVATRIAAGLSSAEIAESLAVSKVTVRNQITAIMGKMDVHRQAEIVVKIAALAPRLKL